MSRPPRLSTAMLRFVICLLLLLSLATDSAPTKPYQIYFLGDKDAPAKNAYDTLSKVLTKTHPELTRHLVIRYIEIPPPGLALNHFLQRVASHHPQMVIALSGPEALAAKQAFTAVPIIFASFDEPLEYGVISNAHSRPEPICGVSLADMLEGKRFEILKQAFPSVHRIGVLADRQWAEAMGGRLRTEQEAARHGLSVTVMLAENAAEVGAALQSPEAARHDAWYIPATPVSDHSAPAVISQLRTWRKPSIWTAPEEVALGAPMAYAQETGFVWRSLADLIARVHGGEHPGEIPILRPTDFTLTVRIEPTSPIPPPHISIVRRADRVIR